MANVLVMPKLGLTMTEGTISKWHKNVGDSVKSGEILYDVETDKLTNEIESKNDGVLLKILVPEGDTVPCLVPVAIIGSEGEDISGLSGAQPQSAEAAGGKAEQPVEEDRASAAGTEAVKRPEGARIIASPATKKAAAERNIPLEKVRGTGPDGRITLKDLDDYTEEVRVKSTPVAKKIADEMNIDLSAIETDGKRVMKADVIGSVKQDLQAETIVPMSAIRKIIAKRMSESRQTCPSVNYDISVEMSALQSMKESLKKDNIKVSYTDMLIYIVARTLPEFPLMNCSIDGDRLIYKNYVNIGVAVAITDGLLVPVIKDTNLKGMKEISAELISLSEGAKTGKLSTDSLKGGTFTITNLGMFGIESFTPIINLPEVAILGVNTIQNIPVYENGVFIARPVMKLSLAADHRAVDGAVAAQFLSRLKKNMENPYLLML